MPRSESGLRTMSGRPIESRTTFTNDQGFDFKLARYPTSESSSSFGRLGYAFITGFRSAFVLAVISGAATIHWRISSAFNFAPTVSSAPFLLPTAPTEWHTWHFWAV